MKPPRLVLLGFALLGPAGQPGAATLSEDPVIARVAAGLDGMAVIRAEFTQSRHLAALTRPVVTRGRLVFSRQHGVLWQIEHPYRHTYVLGEESIVEIASDGARRIRALRDVPGLAQVSRVFRSLLHADRRALDDYFLAHVNGTSAHWEMQLVPKQAQAASALKKIRVHGGRFVENIQIEEGGGDHLTIQFHHSRGAEALTAPEAELFRGE